MDYKDRCRTCMAANKEMRHVNAIISIAGDEVSLADILETFYQYKIPPDEDLFPQNLCINCVHQLTITYSFKILIESSSKTLANLANCVTTDSNDDFEYEYELEENKQERQRTKCIKKKTIPKAKPDNDLKFLFCVECKAEFHSVKSLKDHCSSTHTVRSTVGRHCEYCHEKFEDFRCLVVHRKLHLQPYVCENCWEGFYSINELNAHLCTPHIETKDRKCHKNLQQCDQCGKSYPSGYIKIHMKTHSNDRAYSCKFCPKKFKVPGGLNSHILWNHKRTRNHKCEICNATFISSSSRSSHIRKNHLKEKKYHCGSCEKRFFSKSELDRHSLTHTGVKNFHCHLCDKSYQTRYGLNVHLKSHSHMSINDVNTSDSFKYNNL
ncbi:zinc finger protein 699-like [Plodia interpunctella]|uniref:zinc finger protein 699-like n=1 Tax=Plodia interpunctella TaxID=58824 RepID=UPI002368692C|nr:zinc finger protein 699-like [Plodia interpunctella]